MEHPSAHVRIGVRVSKSNVRLLGVEIGTDKTCMACDAHALYVHAKITLPRGVTEAATPVHIRPVGGRDLAPFCSLDS